MRSRIPPRVSVMLAMLSEVCLLAGSGAELPGSSSHLLLLTFLNLPSVR